MDSKNYSTTLLVDASPEKVFEAVTNPRGWWSENIEGGTEKLNDEFNYHYKDMHRCTMKLTEVIPNKKVVWDVMENYFSFTKDKREWTGDKIIFEITPHDNKSQLRFTQIGLVPECECYDICNDAWTGYIQGSLRKLIETGKGDATPKDNDGKLNEQVIEKHSEKFKNK